MMLGKRGHPPFRRTTSMTGISFNLGDIEAAPPLPPPGAQMPMIGSEFGGYDMLSPRYFRKNFPVVESTADFLRSCGLCNRHLARGHDICMYRGDTAFCSLECREQQMKQDERKERCAATKNAESHGSELVATAPESTGKSGAVAAA
ncbi:hypothetical protein RD792_015748 [Penstemon davidsonii]|uniref:FLZ-type domain-containing protein n=1 Tax=Penstemon davidsonii TaxID=160366 RepID=A0ABR0CJB0_9LAMI|nr:hypothetical protein RD792_015748 [Penstemon davidsonii]